MEATIILRLFLGYIGIMKKKIETTIMLGAILGLYWDYL